ncbi:hypothetical protein DRQ36_08775 [bacterium]|nr:MAG: hypothetical protein DRQ36_08775 [bacterium]
MLQLRPSEELYPRLDLAEGDRVLAVNGPNIVEGYIDADFRSGMELQQLKKETYDAIFAWFTDPDEEKAKEVVIHASRIAASGGSVWLIVPKKNSVENHKATGVLSDRLIPLAKKSGLNQKKTLGVGPHYYAIKMQKHG